MSLEEVLDRVASATVRLPAKGGQGVVVPGQMIVTAGHCVRWKVTGGMGLGDPHVEAIDSAARDHVVAQVYAVEPVADIAVLGALDGQSAPNEADAFESWCNTIEPVPLCVTEFPLFDPFPVWIRAHTGRWVEARAQQLMVHAAGLAVRTREGIEGGTSGGPCMTEGGLLLGVVSSSGGVKGEPSVEMEVSRLHLSVPGRYLRTMLDPAWESRAFADYARQHGRPTPRTPFWPEGWDP